MRIFTSRSSRIHRFPPKHGLSQGVWVVVLDRLVHLLYSSSIACGIVAEQLFHQSKQHHENYHEGVAEPIPDAFVCLLP